MGLNPPLLCLSPVRFGAVPLAARAAGSNGSDRSGAADQDAASQQNLAPWALGDPCPHIRDRLSWWEAQQRSQVLLNTGAAGRAESRGHCWTAPNWSTSASGLIILLGNQQLLPSPVKFNSKNKTPGDPGNAFSLVTFSSEQVVW